MKEEISQSTKQNNIFSFFANSKKFFYKILVGYLLNSAFSRHKAFKKTIFSFLVWNRAWNNRYMCMVNKK